MATIPRLNAPSTLAMAKARRLLNTIHAHPFADKNPKFESSFVSTDAIRSWSNSCSGKVNVEALWNPMSESSLDEENE